MTPEQQRALYDALLSAFSTAGDFEKVVTSAFGKSLDQLGGTGDLEAAGRDDALELGRLPRVHRQVELLGKERQLRIARA
jgi:hypothetical protein